MPYGRVWCALAILVSAASPAVRAGVTIDNFEEGPFSIKGPSPFSAWTSEGLNPANTLRGERESNVQPAGVDGPVSASLTLTDADDGVAVTMTDPAAPNRLLLTYGWRIPLDYNVVATGLDYALVRLDEAPVGGTLGFSLRTYGPNREIYQGTAERPITGPGDYVIPLLPFAGAGVSRSDVDMIQIELRDVMGAYRVSDVSFVPEPWATSLLAVASVALRRRGRSTCRR